VPGVLIRLNNLPQATQLITIPTSSTPGCSRPYAPNATSIDRETKARGLESAFKYGCGEEGEEGGILLFAGTFALRPVIADLKRNEYRPSRVLRV